MLATPVCIGVLLLELLLLLFASTTPSSLLNTLLRVNPFFRRADEAVNAGGRLGVLGLLGVFELLELLLFVSS